MTKILRTLLITLIMTAVCSLSALAVNIKCTECGMFVDMTSKFTSKIVQSDTTFYFCDIGDLFSYMKRKGLNDVAAQVKDYNTSEWIDAKQAYYVHSEKKFMTPMGWSIAAFKDEISASKFGSVMDFKATAMTVK